MLVIPGRAKREPGIHNHSQCEIVRAGVMDSGPRYARPE
jgi:hypothetical protein